MPEGSVRFVRFARRARKRRRRIDFENSCIWALLTSIVGEPIPILHTHGQTFTTSMVVFDKLNIILVLVPTEYE